MKCVSKTMSSVLEKFADIFNENMIFTSFEEFALHYCWIFLLQFVV